MLYSGVKGTMTPNNRDLTLATASETTAASQIQSERSPSISKLELPPMHVGLCHTQRVAVANDRTMVGQSDLTPIIGWQYV